MLMSRVWWVWLASLLLVGCGGPVSRVDLAGGSAQQEADKPVVLMVGLTGKLGTVELARCHRTLREAVTQGVTRVIFKLQDCGDQGDDLFAMQSLFDRIQGGEVQTVAVLGGRVTHGGAALALCCGQIYCLRGAQWGEVTKPDKDTDDYYKEDPDQAVAARFDAVREMLQTRLDRRPDKLSAAATRLALAMADPRDQLLTATVREGGLERQRVLDANELTALKAQGASVFGELTLPRPLILDAQQAEEYGLTSGTLPGLSQLAEFLNIDPDRIGELNENWAERMVAWLELLQPFLLVAGFLLLMIEIKTPGVGLPGLLGAAFLGLALFHSYLVGLAEVTEILVFFLGLGAIAVEIFVLPGTIVFGLVGFLCLVLSLVLSRQSFVFPHNQVEQEILLANLANLTLLFVLVIVLGAAMWRILPKVPLFNRLFLTAPGGGREPQSNSAPSGLGIESERLVALVGRVGRAATVLRPTGTMELEGDRIDVVTEGEYVEAGQSLRVLYVQGNRVVVAADATDPRAGERGSVGVVVLLLIVGLALIVAEVLFVSFGVIATMAGAALLGAVFVAFQESTAFGVGIVITEAIAAPIVLLGSFRILPKTPFGKALILSGPATAGSAGAGDQHLAELLHQRGVTLSPLRPAGFARIGGHKVDVVTRGEMVDRDAEIVVLEVSGNRVVVARVDQAPADA
ncbi:MAG: NfeD family protein [Planctomycetota bacterium]